MLNRMRMRHVRCFLAVAKAGSVTAAAEAMNSSQPALSRSLSELEALIGQPLFTRTGRGLALTEAGQTLHRYLDMAVAQLEMGTALAKGDRLHPKVSVGILPNVARTLAVDAASTFKAARPETDLTFQWATVKELMDLLYRNEIDMILGRLLSVDVMTGMSFEPLYAENLIFIAHRDHPFAERAGQLAVQDLVDETLLIPLPGVIIRKELDKFLTARGISRFSNVIESVSFEFARSYIRKNNAIACIPIGAARRELDDGTFVDLGIEGEELTSSVGISRPVDHTWTAEAEIFAEHVRVAAQQYH